MSHHYWHRGEENVDALLFERSSKRFVAVSKSSLQLARGIVCLELGVFVPGCNFVSLILCFRLLIPITRISSSRSRFSHFLRPWKERHGSFLLNKDPVHLPGFFINNFGTSCLTLSIIQQRVAKSEVEKISPVSLEPLFYRVHDSNPLSKAFWLCKEPIRISFGI